MSQACERCIACTGGDRSRQRSDAAPVQPTPDLQPLSPELLAFFQQRGISRATLDAAGVMQERRFVKQLGRVDDVIAFVYKRRDQIVNVKYRTKDKRFSQVTTKWSCCLFSQKCVAKHSSLACAVLL